MNRPFLQSAIALFATFALLIAGLYLSSGAAGENMFMPHSHCYLFNRDLMWLHGGSDLLIGLSYVAISATLAWLVFRARRELPFHWVMIAFAIFIIACGATHLMEVWTLHAAQPRYWLSGWVKLVTAIASLTTAVVVPPLIPRVLEMMEAARLSAERGEKLEHAYQELNALYAKVTRLDQLKTNFFANVSHELRTPLALIFAPIERLLTVVPEPAARRELMVVRRNALLLHKHVNDLLDVSKLEVGRLELHYTRLDVDVLARTIAGIFQSVVGERGIRVEVQTPGTAVAEVDGDKMQRVFMNLVANAFKYAPDDSVVRLALAEEGDHLVFTVEDAGPGVAPEMRATIFERFQQGDRETQRRYGGTGLGLSIVKEFVEMHGGTISVGERPGGGASFRVRLPRSAPHDADVRVAPWSGTDAVLQRLANAPAQERIAPPRSAAPEPEPGRPEILVVEDNQDMREFVCRVLEPEARTRAVEHGGKALVALEEQTADLVITDMMMPVMNGEEFVAALRRDDRWRDVPVILLTAKADEGLKLNMLLEGAQDYVMKPFSIEELRVRVRNQLQTKLTRDRLRLALDSRSEDLAGMVRELAAAKSAADAANAAKDDFLAVLSHELRTPLTPALAAASELLRTPPADAAELRDLLAIICRNIELEARLVDDLLDVTRIIRGKLRVQATPIDLHAVLRDALSMAGPALQKKHIVVENSLASITPWVRGDAGRLGQVFSNLLTNAAKFTSEGGKVTLRCGPHGASVRVEIVDSGIGIAPEVLSQIFDPFRQGEVGTTRRFGGLGLGLSIARGLVEAHDGTISVQSDGPGRGATFVVELPALGGGAVEEPVVVAAPQSGETATSLRVLLVEDHEDTRHVLRRLMTRWGHEVTTAASVAEAQGALGQGTFDLLLTDVGLPDGSGLQIIANLRETSAAPAVAMSGFGMESDVARAHAAGFTEHLTKPIAAEQLRHLLGRFSRSA